jgi:hypothetical protein
MARLLTFAGGNGRTCPLIPASGLGMGYTLVIHPTYPLAGELYYHQVHPARLDLQRVDTTAGANYRWLVRSFESGSIIAKY